MYVYIHNIIKITKQLKSSILVHGVRVDVNESNDHSLHARFLEVTKREFVMSPTRYHALCAAPSVALTCMSSCRGLLSRVYLCAGMDDQHTE